MSDFSEWHDPFADDEAALERERRRAEREARRREQLGQMSEKVAAEKAASEAAEAAAKAHAEAEARAAAAAEPPAADPDPPTAAERVVAAAAAESHPATAEHAPLETGESPALPPAQAAPPGRPSGMPPRPHDTTRRETIIRRVIGIAFLIALLAIAGFGAKKVLDKVSGDDEVFQKPVKALAVEDITIPEGLDRRQIADVAKKAGLKGDYEDATKKPPKGFDFDDYGAEDAENLEGFLFPATYEVEKDAKVEDLVDKQLDAFTQNIDGVNLKNAESKNLTPYDVVIIASMIEREIAVPDERDDAAAVIYNRLKAGTPLGIDATIRYEDQNYTEQLTESRLEEPTPYNTRVNTGLPPGPISNPGLASLEAAANPAKSDAFFFVVKPGSCNEHVFVETEEEFAQAEAEYQAALQEQGGSPTEC